MKPTEQSRMQIRLNDRKEACNNAYLIKGANFIEL
jgi:hypothetical protein